MEIAHITMDREFTVPGARIGLVQILFCRFESRDLNSSDDFLPVYDKEDKIVLRVPKSKILYISNATEEDMKKDPGTIKFS